MVAERVKMTKNQNNWSVFPGFEIEHVATGLTLPVNIAFVPNPKDDLKDPLLYITELYGQVKVITNDGSVYTYAKNLLNLRKIQQDAFVPIVQHMIMNV